jgi:hypothetical protein
MQGFVQHIEIDSRFLGEWVEYGITQIEQYLDKHARFAAYCARRAQSTGDSH